MARMKVAAVEVRGAAGDVRKADAPSGLKDERDQLATPPDRALGRDHLDGGDVRGVPAAGAGDARAQLRAVEHRAGVSGEPAARGHQGTRARAAQARDSAAVARPPRSSSSAPRRRLVRGELERPQHLGEVARREQLGPRGVVRDERRLLLGADLLRLPAARAEAAARRRVRRARHVALEHDPARACPRWFGDSIGTAESSACVYGCIGALVDRPRASPISTILPRYMTATRSEMWRTTERSWAMNR